MAFFPPGFPKPLHPLWQLLSRQMSAVRTNGWRHATGRTTRGSPERPRFGAKRSKPEGTGRMLARSAALDHVHVHVVPVLEHRAVARTVACVVPAPSLARAR